MEHDRLLVHVAIRHWNHDQLWHAMLVEAVFPIYLVHHLILVWLAWTLPLGLPMAAAFALLASGTAAASLGFYLIGREIAWLRPFIGLAAARRTARPVAAAIG